MARIAAQEMAADFLRAQGTAFVKVMGDGHQLARERGDALRLFARGGGLIRTARCREQLSLGGPAGAEGGIEPNRPRIGRQRFRIASLRAGEMTGLLPGAAVFGHFSVEPRQIGCGLAMAIEIAGRDGCHVQRIRIRIRSVACEQLFGLRQPGSEIALLQRVAAPIETFAVIAHARAPCKNGGRGQTFRKVRPRRVCVIRIAISS